MCDCLILDDHKAHLEQCSLVSETVLKTLRFGPQSKPDTQDRQSRNLETSMNLACG